MTRAMFDSTNVADDPLGAALVGYYCDGIYATTAARVRQRFPSAVLVPISAIGSNAGVVGDVEPGCMTVPQSIGWVKMRRAAGVDPTLYVNQTYGWASLQQAFRAAGVPEPHWWVADYDGRPVIPPGAVAKQFANPPLTHGHFDRSVVADYWPGVDVRAGDSSHTGELDMATADEIFNLLNAVNTVTLKRIEDKLDAVNAVTLGRIEAEVLKLPTTTAAGVAVDLSPVLSAIADAKAVAVAIKVKTDKDLA